MGRIGTLARRCWALISGGPDGAWLALPIAIFVAAFLLGEMVVGQGITWPAFDAAMIAFLLAWVCSILVVALEMRKAGWWRLLGMADSTDDVRALSWREFQRFVAARFAKQGWRPEIVGGAGPDGGVDIVMRKGKEKAIVQCKQRRYVDTYVEERALREFVGVIIAEKADRGFFVTSGVFSPEALAFAAKVPTVKLVSGADLFSTLDRCPKCGSEMRIKPGKRGAFLSCVRWPECPGARDLPAAA